MSRGTIRRAAVWTLAAFPLGTMSARAQDGALAEAVERARSALAAHAVGSVVATSDTVRLQIPGVTVATALRPAQAAQLLSRYLKDAEERALELVQVRQHAADHAYAELIRRYVVRGTRDELRERVFLGFRMVGGEWRLREVRVTP